MIKRGPLDVIVVAAGKPRFDGSVLAELKRLAAAGTIRVLDAMVLLKEEDGSMAQIVLNELPPELAQAVDFIPAETRGLFDNEDATTLYEGMVPGSAIFAMAIEHLWAVNLVNALYDAGVETAAHFRVPAPVVDEAFASLAAVS